MRKLAQQPSDEAVVAADILVTPAPVILAVAPGSSAGAVDASTGAVVQAAAVNTTHCIRYVDASGRPAGAQQRGQPGQALTYVPPLDLSSCAAIRTVVVSASRNVTLQVCAVQGPPACPALHLGWACIAAGAVRSLLRSGPLCRPGAYLTVLLVSPAGQSDRPSAQPAHARCTGRRRRGGANTVAVPRRRLPCLQREWGVRCAGTSRLPGSTVPWQLNATSLAWPCTRCRLAAHRCFAPVTAQFLNPWLPPVPALRRSLCAWRRRACPAT